MLNFNVSPERWCSEISFSSPLLFYSGPAYIYYLDHIIFKDKNNVKISLLNIKQLKWRRLWIDLWSGGNRNDSNERWGLDLAPPSLLFTSQTLFVAFFHWHDWLWLCCWVNITYLLHTIKQFIVVFFLSFSSIQYLTMARYVCGMKVLL